MPFSWQKKGCRCSTSLNAAGVKLPGYHSGLHGSDERRILPGVVLSPVGSRRNPGSRRAGMGDPTTSRQWSENTSGDVQGSRPNGQVLQPPVIGLGGSTDSGSTTNMPA